MSGTTAAAPAVPIRRPELYLKADHAAKAAGHLSHSNVMVRVGRQARVMHMADHGVLLQPPRQLQSSLHHEQYDTFSGHFAA